MALAKVTKFCTNTNEPQSLKGICFRILSLCNSKSLKEGVCVHSPIIKLSLNDDLYMTNNLLSLYTKCFGVQCARHLFDEMPERDVVSWTGMLSGYVRNGYHDQALDFFDSMIASGHCPNQFTLSSILRSCSFLGELDHGTRVQTYVIKLGLESNQFVGSSIIDLYTKCGCTEEACRVFRGMESGDTVSWTTMISSLVEARKWSQALGHYMEMLSAGVQPNESTFVKVLAAASALGLRYGRSLHAHLIILGMQLNVILKTALVNVYSKGRKMKDAVKVSKQTPEFDVLLWTSIISGFTENLRVAEAISALHEMELSGVAPNDFTYSSILKGCSAISSIQLWKQIHSRMIKSGLEGKCAGNALVDMYMKCSDNVEDALRVFGSTTTPDVITWTSLIAGFTTHGFEQNAFQSFLEMQASGVQPNSITLSSILRACSTSKSRSQTLKVHGHIIKTEAAGSDIAVSNALVEAYAALEMVDDVWRVINTMIHRDVITYTSLATRLNQMGHFEITLSVINRMFVADIKMDGYSLASFLSASAGLATIETGKQLHCYSVKAGLRSGLSVSNALVDMYGKCGCIDDVQRAFSEIALPDIVTWNGLISGLASNGYISSSLSAFEDMRLAGIKPDAITFLSVLFACSRGSLVESGLEYFHSMTEKYHITPQLYHYACLVDLFARAGQLENAMEVIMNMPYKPDALIYKTMLAACTLHRNLALGEDMARRGIELDPSDPALYVLLANLYDDSGQPDLAKSTRKLMRERGLEKNNGQCWMEIRNKVHIFEAGDRSHPEITEINGKVESLIAELKKRGCSVQDYEDSPYHIEKLAVAFGLLNAPAYASIRISKTVRMCSECHEFVMLVSQFVGREIIVRDGNRLHVFNKGQCSCKAALKC